MRIMIIGGTSGIGLALASHYLQQGDSVAICGRDLARVDPDWAARHSGLSMVQFDIADRAAVSAALDDVAAGGIDLLIVSAGLYGDAAALQRDPALALRMVQVNVSGLEHAFSVAAGKMLPRRAGQLVAISSIAGLIKDYPGGSLYSTAKRGVLAICDTYRHALAASNIAVTAIVPGYVDTAKLRELSGGDASGKPFLQTEQQAVAQITSAIAARRALHVFPWQLHCLVRIFNILPLWLRQWRRK